MYISQSLLDGLKILGFDRETIKRVSREKSLEEIFLSTLFMNYLIVVVVFIVATIMGGISVNGREVNQPVFFGLLMVYPFIFNLAVYLIYGFFGVVSELLNKSKTVKPLIAVGFHTAIVYTLLIYIIGLLTTFDVGYGTFLLGVFFVYFLLTMFLSLSEIYQFSGPQTLIVIFVPIMIFFLVIMALMTYFDLSTIIAFFLV